VGAELAREHDAARHDCGDDDECGEQLNGHRADER
jgi:hypothetical protein